VSSDTRSYQLNRWLMISLILLFGFYRTANATGVDFERKLHLGTWSPFASYWERESPVCAWTQTEEVAFRIIAFGQSKSGNFELSNGVEGLPFRVFWNNYGNSIGGELLVAGTPSRGAYYFNPELGCGLSPNYSMRLRISKPDLDYAMPGYYTGSLVLMLSPI